MGSVGISAVRIIDSDNEVVAVTSNALDVNIAGGATIDIGDVDMFLDGGTAVLGGAGAVAAGVLRTTLASDDYQFGSHDDASSSVGSINAKLRYIATQTQGAYGLLGTIDTDTGNIANYLGYPLKSLGTDTYTEGSEYSYAVAAVRNDILAALAGTDNEFAPLQVNDIGALYTTGNTIHGGINHSYNFTVMGETKVIDGSALPNTAPEGRNIRLAASTSGIAYTCLTDDAGASDLGTTITTHLSEIEGAIETIEAAVDTQMQVDVVAALPAGSNTIGVVDLGSTDNAVLDAMVVDLAAMEALLITIDSDTDAIKTAVQILDDWDDSNYANVNINLAGSDAPTGGGAESGALRVTLANDSTGVISIDDGGNTITVDGTVTANLGATDNAVLDAIAAKFPNWFVTDAGTAPSPVEYPTITYDPLDGIVTVGAVCKDVLAAHSGVTDDEYTTLQVDTQGALYTTHGITGMTHGKNLAVGTSAEVLKTSTACKRVDMMADWDNTGYIHVGSSSVTTSLGIRLAPGDFYSIDCNNTADIYVVATVADEDIHFIYYT